MHWEGHEPAGLSMLRRLVTVQQDQIRHISDLSLKLVEAHFFIRDHFGGLYHKHEALVSLLEELGLLSREKLQGCVAESDGGGSGFMGVLSTSSSASAILVGAGQNTLGALCCASRSCIETLAALLVRAPCCEAASSDDQVDEKDDFQAHLWRSAWQPTLAIWEATGARAALSDRESCVSSRPFASQARLREATASHASYVGQWDPLVSDARNAAPCLRAEDRGGADEDLSSEALTITPGTSNAWRPLFPGAKDIMSLQNTGDRGWPLEAQRREAAVSPAHGALPESMVHECTFREDEVAAYSEATLYLDKVKDVLSRSRMGEAMVEALHREPVAYLPGDDTWQPVVGEDSGVWLGEDILRSAAALPREEDALLWPNRDEHVLADRAAAEVHLGFSGAQVRDAVAEQTRSKTQDKRHREDAPVEAQHSDVAVQAGHAAVRKHPVPVIKELLPQPGSEEAKRTDRPLVAKRASIAPTPPTPATPTPATRTPPPPPRVVVGAAGEEAFADSSLFQALADVALKRTLLQALANPSSEVVADRMVQSPGVCPEEHKAPVRRPSEQAGTHQKLIANGFQVVLRHLGNGGFPSRRALWHCSWVCRAFHRQLRREQGERALSKSASRPRQSLKPKSRRQESTGQKLADTPERQHRTSGFTQMLKGREKVQQQVVRVSNSMAQAPRVTSAATAEEEIRRQFLQISAVNRASEPLKGNNHIRTGELVQVQGLSRRPDLNGVTGTVLNWIPKTGRWQVMLSTGEQVRLQRDNLVLMAWCQQLPKVLVLCEVASVVGLKLADFVGAAPICIFKATCSRLRRSARSHMELAIYGGLGNKITGRRLDAFNVGSNTWKVYPPSHHAHYMGCSAVLNGHLYLCGGLDSYATRFVECVVPATNSWEDLPRLRHPRFGAQAVAITGRLMVLGGICDEQVLSSVESYLPGENKWEEEPWMQHARCFFQAGIVGGKLLVCGGRKEAAPQESFSKANSSRDQYDVARRAFPGSVEGSRLFDGEEEHRCRGHTFQDKTELFCPYVQKWKDAPSTSKVRSQSADVVFKGLYIACGGFDGREHFRSVEAFDPDLYQWRRMASMATQRVAASACAVESTGNVLVVGGYDMKGILRTMECLDFDRGCWESILPMTVPRMNPYVTVIGDSAFICGGFNEEGATPKIEGFCIRKRARLKITNVPVSRSEFMGLSLPC